MKGLGLPKETNFDFVRLAPYGFAFTIITVIAAVVSIWVQGFNLGIDFTGGVVIEVESQQPIDVAGVRAQIGALNAGDVTLQSFSNAFGSGHNLMIRVQPAAGMTEQAVVAKIKETLGGAYTILRTEAVGPAVSGELWTSGVIATILAVVMIAVYVAVRFEWQYGLAAFISTGHDVFVTAGLFSLLQITFDLTSVAALLTLAGYSINDTVVVFDRMRENRRRHKRMPLGELINLSTNQTLARTIMTSATTLIAILPVMVFVPSLYNFSGAIVFGVLIGTYSSIYVAAAILTLLPPLASEPDVRPQGGTAASAPSQAGA